jgi:poly(3-hydroxybutyrate) depolymerase
MGDTMKRCLLALAVVIVAAAGANGQNRAEIGPGNGEQSAALPGATLRLFTYRPTDCTPDLLLLAFHGVQRDAGPYRDHARPLADRLCALVVAPQFDKQRFPRDLYQYGGIVQNGVAVTPGGRTVDLVAPLAAWARAAAGSPQMPYVLLGHSAGAQFVDRVAAFATTDAARMVAANPSTWVMPSLAEPAPFGFGRFGPTGDAEAALRAYLARPLVVLLGDADTGKHNLAASPEAMAQGPYRLARGRNAFRQARETAARMSWPFNWTLVEIPGVGHNAAAMFAAPQTAAALEDLSHPRP